MKADPGKKRVYLTVRGKVQGVFFRKNVKEKADQLGVYGWIQNTPTGDVDIVVEGSSSALDEFLRYCRRGPTFAKVDAVDVHEGEFENEFDSFFIKPG